ncbi:MAG: MarC family protein [Desulfurobacteriaceae bacterium]
MELFKYLISTLIVVDPIFAAIVVASLIQSQKEIEKVAFRTSMTVLVAFIVTMVAGEKFLKLIGVNIFSIKIFGGLILLHMAFQMLQANPPRTKHTQEEGEAAMEKEDISIIPLGIPILFGPGAFTTVLIFKEETRSILEELSLLLALLISVVIIYFTLKNAGIFAKKLGTTGVNVSVRVFGLFVGALGSQFVVDGVKHLWIQG